MSRRTILPIAGLVGLLAPVALFAPRGRDYGAPSVADLVGQIRAQGLTGVEEVNAAMALVAQQYHHYSAWHLWESAETSLRFGRGWSHQYNRVLLKVLRELGYPARMVHASWVRGWRHPWYQAGHSWVKVEINERDYDACASLASNRIGQLPFTPVSPEMRMRRFTRVLVSLQMLPFVTGAVWKSLLSRTPPSSWLYHRRSDH